MLSKFKPFLAVKMKMITILILGFLFTLFFVSGCEKRPQYEIYENHDITVCGVKDPLRNMEWIKNYCAEHSKAYFIKISLYQDLETNANYFVIESKSDFIPGRSPSCIFSESVYSCDGVQLLFYGVEGPIPEGWDEFFEKVKLVGTIWSCERVDKKYNHRYQNEKNIPNTNGRITFRSGV